MVLQCVPGLETSISQWQSDNNPLVSLLPKKRLSPPFCGHRGWWITEGWHQGQRCWGFSWSQRGGWKQKLVIWAMTGEVLDFGEQVCSLSVWLSCLFQMNLETRPAEIVKQQCGRQLLKTILKVYENFPGYWKGIESIMTKSRPKINT